ncbi:MAG: dethiobiotin synthase [Parahaliea sp.]
MSGIRKRAWFVTGTDTEVGKTAVSCALLKAAEQQGLCTLGLKPVAAGCDAQGHNGDALALMAAMTQSLPYAQVNPVALPLPLAPHIAAGRAGKRVQISQLAGLCRGAMGGAAGRFADITLIEGAGGWRVPLNERETLADLARELQLGVIMVVGMRLGCINHALLTAEAIHRDGLPLVGWVANQCDKIMDGHQENIETLRRWLGVPLLGDIPHIVPFDAILAANHLDFNNLLSL